MAASIDEDDAPVLFSMHPTTFQRFVDAVNAYPGPVHPPVGLVFAVPVTNEALMLAILDYLRGAGTPKMSAAPIGIDLFAMHSGRTGNGELSSLCLGEFAVVCRFASFCTWNHNWAHRVYVVNDPGAPER